MNKNIVDILLVATGRNALQVWPLSNNRFHVGLDKKSGFCKNPGGLGDLRINQNSKITVGIQHALVVKWYNAVLVRQNHKFNSCLEHQKEIV